MESENSLLSAIISDYVIAANKNYEVNENKAKLLSKALFCLIVGLIFFVISAIMLCFLTD